MSYIASSVICKPRGGDKNSLARLLCLERSGKLHNIRPSYSVSAPPLRLDVNNVQSKLVFFDYSVYSLIPTLADSLAGVKTGATVAHLYE